MTVVATDMPGRGEHDRIDDGHSVLQMIFGDHARFGGVGRISNISSEVIISPG
jgi:hypothetical protein